MNTKKITNNLKGIAILMVILCHSHQVFDLPFFLNELFSFLQIGVQLFILLSSFGLCFSYNKTPVNWLNFMKKRIRKIALPYWVAIVLAVIYRFAYALFMHKNILYELNLKGIVINFLFLHGISFDSTINNQIVRGGWFVGTIVILYALFPLLYRIYFLEKSWWKKARKLLFPLLAAFISILGLIIFKICGIIAPIEQIFLQFPVFSLGFSLYEIVKNEEYKKIAAPAIKGIAFTLISLGLFFINGNFKRFYILAAGLAFFYFLIFAVSREEKREIKKSFSNAFSKLGKYSFSIYLTQSYVAFDVCYVLKALLSFIYVNDLLWFVTIQPFVIVLAFFVGKCFEGMVDLCKKPFKKKNENVN